MKKDEDLPRELSWKKLNNFYSFFSISMKTIVIYKSLSGFTKKYAEWIAQETKADLFDLKEISSDILKKYDCVVFGGGLHAATINGLGKMK